MYFNDLVKLYAVNKTHIYLEPDETEHKNRFGNRPTLALCKAERNKWSNYRSLREMRAPGRHHRMLWRHHQQEAKQPEHQPPLPAPCRERNGERGLLILWAVNKGYRASCGV